MYKYLQYKDKILIYRTSTFGSLSGCVHKGYIWQYYVWSSKAGRCCSLRQDAQHSQSAALTERTQMSYD